MAYSPITAIPLILAVLAIVILTITLTLKRASKGDNGKRLQLASGVVVGWVCGLPLFFYFFGWLGNSIWASYPGYPYLLYLAVQAFLGLVLLVAALMRITPSARFKEGLLTGACAAIFTNPFIVLWLIWFV